MQRLIYTCIAGCRLLLIASTLTAQSVTTPEAFKAADFEGKRQTIVAIIRHELAVSGASVAELIEAGLTAEDPRVREGALAAVVSRAAGPQFSPQATNDWALDHAPLQALRPMVARILTSDPAENVRDEAVSALVSLDFDITTHTAQLSEPTKQLLIERFYKDSSARVRSKIVGGFGTDSAADSDSIRKMFLDAFGDADPRVRQAAMSGVEKVNRETALAFLVKELHDSERALRGQAASVLAKFGPQAASYLPQITQALRAEQDPQVRQLLEVAVNAISR